jgi:hypothetical protein
MLGSAISQSAARTTKRAHDGGLHVDNELEEHAMTNAEAIATPSGQGEVVTPQSRDGSPADLVPEKRLMLAVLESAVNDFRTYNMIPTGRGRQLFMEVAAWFDSSTTGPFDFEGICEATGLDPDFIRSRLAVQTKDNAEVSPK